MSVREGLQHLNDKVQSLYNASLSSEEYLPDTPFTIEELEQAGLLAEHLKFGGQAILNVAVENYRRT